MFRLKSSFCATALLFASLNPATGSEYRTEIGMFVSAEDWVGLRSFLKDKPELLEQNTRTGRELRNFVAATTGLYAALTFRMEDFPDLSAFDTIQTVERPRPRTMKLTDIIEVSRQEIGQSQPDLTPRVKAKSRKPVASKSPKRKMAKRALVKPQQKPVARKRPSIFASQEEVVRSTLPMVVAAQLTKNGTRKIKKSTLRLYERVKNNRD